MSSTAQVTTSLAVRLRAVVRTWIPRHVWEVFLYVFPLALLALQVGIAAWSGGEVTHLWRSYPLDYGLSIAGLGGIVIWLRVQAQFAQTWAPLIPGYPLPHLIAMNGAILLVATATAVVLAIGGIGWGMAASAGLIAVGGVAIAALCEINVVRARTLLPKLLNLLGPFVMVGILIYFNEYREYIDRFLLGQYPLVTAVLVLLALGVLVRLNLLLPRLTCLLQDAGYRHPPLSWEGGRIATSRGNGADPLERFIRWILEGRVLSATAGGHSRSLWSEAKRYFASIPIHTGWLILAAVSALIVCFQVIGLFDENYSSRMALLHAAVVGLLLGTAALAASVPASWWRQVDMLEMEAMRPCGRGRLRRVIEVAVLRSLLPALLSAIPFLVVGVPTDRQETWIQPMPTMAAAAPGMLLVVAAATLCLMTFREGTAATCIGAALVAIPLAATIFIAETVSPTADDSASPARLASAAAVPLLFAAANYVLARWRWQRIEPGRR